MQAIQTKYLGPTNTRGDRHKAACWAGSVTVPMDWTLDAHDNHKRAAMALCAKLGWGGRMVGGTLLKSNTMVWVFDDKSSPSFEIQTPAKDSNQ